MIPDSSQCGWCEDGTRVVTHAPCLASSHHMSPFGVDNQHGICDIRL